MELPLWKSVVVTLWMPAIVIHELTHYVAARLLGLNVEDVALFGYSPPYIGVVEVYEPDGIPEWKREIVHAAPLFVCGPLAYYNPSVGVRRFTVVSRPSRACAREGFAFFAMPDQFRDWAFERMGV